MGISVTFGSICTVNGGLLPLTLPDFRNDDFFRSSGLPLSSLDLRDMVGLSSTPTGLTAHSDSSSSSSGKSNAGASSNDIFVLSLNRTSVVPVPFELGSSASDSLVFLAGVICKAEYGLMEVCQSVGGESSAMFFARFVSTLIPNLAPGVPGDGARFGGTNVGSRAVEPFGVTIVGGAIVMILPVNDDFFTRSAIALEPREKLTGGPLLCSNSVNLSRTKRSSSIDRLVNVL